MADWKSNPVVGVVLGLVIVIALFFVIKSAMPKKYSYTADLKCEACSAVFRGKVTSGQRPPYKCQECGSKSAYRAVRCIDCGEIFVQKPVEISEDATEEDRMELEVGMMEPKCPECGSSKIGSVTPPASATK